MALQERQRVLLLKYFHSHWRLQRDGEPQILLEPRQGLDSRVETVSNSRTPRQSTRREPSAFEELEKTRGRHPNALDVVAWVIQERRAAVPQGLKILFGTAEVDPLSELAMEPVVTATSPMPHNAHRMDTIAEAELEAQVVVTGDVLGDARLGEVSTGSVHESTAHQSLVLPDAAEAEATQFAQRGSQKMPYDAPEAIYERYVTARTKWYTVQPAGSIKTNQQYRRAMGLPLGFDRASYDWCLDYKQMNKQCSMNEGPKDWTGEEMMAYLDWSRAEDDRIEDKVVLAELGINPMDSGKRGVKHTWKQIDEDSREQEAVHSANQGEEECIVVRP